MGLLLADFRLDNVRSRMLRLGSENLATIRGIYDELGRSVRADLEASAPEGKPNVTYSIDLRYVGQGYELSLEVDPFAEGFLDDVIARFHALHQIRMGHSYPGQPVRAINYRAKLTVPQREFDRFATPRRAEGNAQEHGTIRWQGAQIACTYVARAALGRDDRIAGAAVIEEDSASTFVPPQWTARMDDVGALIIERRNAERE
jgi:N-methylhydantoinase A